MRGPARLLRELAARTHALAQLGPGPLDRPSRSDVERITPLVARALDDQTSTNDSAAADRLFNDPPIFPYDIENGDVTDSESPYHFADATLHLGDTAVPVAVSAIDAEWQLHPRKTDAGRTVLGIDGDVIVVGTVAEDGTVTITQQQPRRRRGGAPDGCPCTAIYSVCICPVSA